MLLRVRVSALCASVLAAFHPRAVGAAPSAKPPSALPTASAAASAPSASAPAGTAPTRGPASSPAAPPPSGAPTTEPGTTGAAPVEPTGKRPEETTEPPPSSRPSDAPSTPQGPGEPPIPPGAARDNAAPIELTSPGPPPLRKRKGVYEHDGFYARFGLGFSGFSDTVVSKATDGDTFRDQGLVSGFATAIEAAAGGTIARGFVLGGGLYSVSVETPSVYDARGQPVPAEFRRPDTFSVLGIMGDLYPNPSRGLHIEAALGLATLSGLNPGSDAWRDRHFAFGFGAMLGVGYEWWVGEEWSLGVLGRATAGALSEDDATGETWFHFVSAWPSVLFTVTYH